MGNEALNWDGQKKKRSGHGAQDTRDEGMRGAQDTRDEGMHGRILFLRLPPSRTVTSAPRSLRACLRASEKRQKNTPVLPDIVTFL